MRSNVTPQHCLFITTEKLQSWNSGEETIVFKAWVQKYEDDDITGDSYHDLSEFVVTAYLTIKTHDSDDKRSWWGWSVGYETHHVDVNKAEAMAKVLRMVTRKLDKGNDIHGYPSDLFSYLLRVGHALGVRQFVTRSTDRQRANSGQRYRSTRKASDVQYWINDIEATYRQQLTYKSAA